MAISSGCSVNRRLRKADRNRRIKNRLQRIRSCAALWQKLHRRLCRIPRRRQSAPDDTTRQSPLFRTRHAGDASRITGRGPERSPPPPRRAGRKKAFQSRWDCMFETQTHAGMPKGDPSDSSRAFSVRRKYPENIRPNTERIHKRAFRCLRLHAGEISAATILSLPCPRRKAEEPGASPASEHMKHGQAWENKNAGFSHAAYAFSGVRTAAWPVWP